MSHADPGSGRRMLATVLFGDIVGSTARLSEIGDARWAQLLAAFRAGVTEITERHAGRYVKSTGDGFLCTFDSASAAAAAAMAIGASAERLSLQLRQGVHAGEIERRGDDVVGLAVHVAARVCDSAGPDEIRATATVRDLLQGSGIEVAFAERTPLRGLDGVWVLHVVAPGDLAGRDQVIGFCRSVDGVRLAHASVGIGRPLVKAANWLTHLQHDWESPLWRPMLDGLASEHTLIRHDQRGCGLSDWDVDRFDLDAWVADLEAVVDAVGVERFDLFGQSQGGAVAIAFAARHPERVSRLVLYGTYVRGADHRPGADPASAAALHTLVRAHWGGRNPAFRRVFATQMIPRASLRELHWFDELQPRSTSAENAARLLEGFNRVDVREQAAQLDVPTLVLHSTGDARIPFDEGLLVAATIPGARFVPLDSDSHILLPREPAFGQMLAETNAFLAEER